MVKSIKKRDGRMVNFDQERVAKSIAKAFRAVAPGNDDAPSRLAERVTKETLFGCG